MSASCRHHITYAVSTVAAFLLAQAAHGQVTVTYEAPGVQQTTTSGVETQSFNSIPLGSDNKYQWNDSRGNRIGTYNDLFVTAADQFGGAGASRYLLQGATSGTTTTTLSLRNDSAYFGFWWSAADYTQGNDVSNNVITFKYNGNTVARFSASVLSQLPSTYLGTPTDGSTWDPGANGGEQYVYINFFGRGSTKWDTIEFSNTSSATGFETDNHSSRIAGWSDSNSGTPLATLSGGSNPVVWSLAKANTLSPVNVGNIRTGNTFTQQPLTLTNTAPADGNSEKLDASITASGSATASGSISLLAAQQTSTALRVGLTSPVAAGQQSGTVTVQMNSNGSGTSGNGLTAMAPQTISITGAAYDYANPVYNAAPINFGNVRVGATRSIAVSNPAISNASYQDDLAVAVASGPGSNVTANSIARIAAGPASQNLTFTAAQAGPLGTTVNLDLISNPLAGTGLTGRTTTGVVTVTGAAYRFATGTLDTTNINLGNVHAGTGGGSLSVPIKVTNTATADGYSDALGLALSGGIPGITYSTPAIALAGAGSQGAGTITLSTANARQISGTLAASLVSTPTVAGLSNATVGSGSLSISANVYSGKSSWTAPVGGNWNSFANWEASGGAPGTDAGFVDTDSATFANAIGSAAATITVDGPVSLRSLTFQTNRGNYTLSGPGTVAFAGTGASLSNRAGNHTIATAVALETDLAIEVSGRDDVLTLSGPINGGEHGITKTGQGTLRIAGTTTYLGLTIVEKGTLDVTGEMAGSVSVLKGGTLLRNGTIGGTVEVEGGEFSPGSQDGTGVIRAHGNSKWGKGGIYHWNVLHVAGSGNQDTLRGDGYDYLASAGQLEITATEAEPFVIDVSSLSTQGQLGSLQEWDAASSHQWTLLSATGGIAGMTPENVKVDARSFMSDNPESTGSFAVLSDGYTLSLVYSIPEPSAYTGILALASLGAAMVRPARRGRRTA